MNLAQVTNFSSGSFLIFWLLCFIAFWISPQKNKKIILLIFSYLFYSSFNLLNLPILIVTTVLDFYIGKIIFIRLQARKNVKPYLLLCILSNLGILLFFKFRFIFSTSDGELNPINLIIPLGISFFTLQSIGYILDIYRGKQVPEKNIITYALFVSFFPQIIAGPIERAKDILPQYQKKFDFKNIEWRKVLYLFFYGCFKKYVIADNIEMLLDKIIINSSSTFLLRYLTLIYFFIRIYCDFSGYTDIAKSISLAFTIRLRENFNFPLFAHSPQDFWDRWHMSLGSWVKSYFYTPLLLLLNNPFGAILIIFPVMGLWHGANINFLFWGLSWALIIILFKKFDFFKIHINRYFQILLMFNFSALLMVFYKVKNFTELKLYFSINHIIEPANHLSDLLKMSILILFVLIYESFLFKKSNQYYLVQKSFFYQVIFYLLLFLIYCNFIIHDSKEFFYLQF